MFRMERYIFWVLGEVEKMKQISSRKWLSIVLITVATVLIGCTALVVIIDPYMHYRLPNNGLSYSFTTQNQRYQNLSLIHI